MLEHERKNKTADAVAQQSWEFDHLMASVTLIIPTLYGIVSPAPPPVRTHLPSVIQGFCADVHGLTA